MKEYEKWVKKAENDLLNIANNLAPDQIPIDTCCFHAKQASGKYLKAYLVSRDSPFPKTHDLQTLILLCVKINPSFIDLSDEAIKLSDFSVATRYPDEFDDLTIANAKNACQNALKIKKFVLRKFLE
jgi:HEPN domain-containing protein